MQFNRKKYWKFMLVGIGLYMFITLIFGDPPLWLTFMSSVLLVRYALKYIRES